MHFLHLHDVIMAAPEAKPFSTGVDTKLTINPNRSNPRVMKNNPTKNDMTRTNPTYSSSVAGFLDPTAAPISSAGIDNGPTASCFDVPKNP